MHAISGGRLYPEGMRAESAADSGWVLISSGYDTSLLSAVLWNSHHLALAGEAVILLQ